MCTRSQRLAVPLELYTVAPQTAQSIATYVPSGIGAGMARAEYGVGFVRRFKPTPPVQATGASTVSAGPTTGRICPSRLWLHCSQTSLVTARIRETPLGIR